MDSSSIEKFKSILSPKVPATALSYCTQLWLSHPFDFKISKTRNTCLGNYRFYQGKHAISINHDLNPYNFLITYIHEVAHMHVKLKNYRKPMPHGKEWKFHFQELMIPMLKEEIFPLEVLKALSKHMINPKASSTRDPLLLKSLRQFDDSKTDFLTIGEIENDVVFNFRNRIFQKKETRRTRALCLCLETKQKYTISLAAQIELVAVG
ncbi:SprT-like family protein [Spirosomataceae bacterium TFI 002]|nr:SprT-like family protein [Spirosomataceae bacterium TFI 002]